MQVTALGQPSLLERVSASLVAIHNMFKTFDADLDGVITRADFEQVTDATYSPQRPSCDPGSLKHWPQHWLRRLWSAKCQLRPEIKSVAYFVRKLQNLKIFLLSLGMVTRNGIAIPRPIPSPFTSPMDRDPREEILSVEHLVSGS